MIKPGTFWQFFMEAATHDSRFKLFATFCEIVDFCKSAILFLASRSNQCRPVLTRINCIKTSCHIQDTFFHTLIEACIIILHFQPSINAFMLTLRDTQIHSWVFVHSSIIHSSINMHKYLNTSKQDHNKNTWVLLYSSIICKHTDKRTLIQKLLTNQHLYKYTYITILFILNHSYFHTFIHMHT